MKTLVLATEPWKKLAVTGMVLKPYVEGPVVTLAVIVAILAALAVALAVEAALLFVLTLTIAVVLAAAFAFVVGLAFLVVNPVGNLMLLFLMPVVVLLRAPATTPQERGLSQTIS